MGKSGRCLRSFLAGGKKGGKKGEAMAAALPGEAAKEKRWSFRRPVHGEKARRRRTAWWWARPRRALASKLKRK
ncbi:hypothetical protein OsI_10118 [Oryza sativa Indica Group]|uniref:Uncharacterized protein n=1 Tax=Oryza sativa subsp. indica TaxID=39946 RepID=A2XCT4_ORYSI|nr:hypothetical protein OsI_10118 [Oryza sativa Indica Group]